MDITPADLVFLNHLRDAVAANAKKHGFNEPPPGVSEEIWRSHAFDIIRAAIYSANQHGEASEFWEAARKGHLYDPCDKADEMVKAGLPGLTCASEEIADEIIRALDKAAEFGVDVAEAVSTKMAFNAARAFRHGGKLA